MTPLEFLSQLWQEKPEDHHILIPVDEVARFEFFQEIFGNRNFNARRQLTRLGILSARAENPKHPPSS